MPKHESSDESLNLNMSSLLELLEVFLPSILFMELHSTSFYLLVWSAHPLIQF